VAHKTLHSNIEIFVFSNIILLIKRIFSIIKKELVAIDKSADLNVSTLKHFWNNPEKLPPVQKIEIMLQYPIINLPKIILDTTQLVEFHFQ
jgi:hypothetical protein